MLRAKMQRGGQLRLYLLISHLFPLIAGSILRKRRTKGKEHPTRWIEKRAKGLVPRPDGPLIWLNAVGLGEVLSLRGLIMRMNAQRPDISFLVTSTTATSAEVFAKNLPAKTIHQFLPIDAPRYRKRFLDHFRPDLCIWAEQDVWPGFVSEIDNRGVPQAVIAARMNRQSFQSHQRVRRLYRDLYQAMQIVTAQEEATAEHLKALGANARVTGSLKPAAPALQHDTEVLKELTTAVQNRTVWAVAPSHAEDEQIAMDAHKILQTTDPSALLIIAPRFPDRRADIAQDCGASLPFRSRGEMPSDNDPVWAFDTFGELGVVYRLAKAVLIGGTFGAVQGHNPWEAAALNTAIFHGPNTANFAGDFTDLTNAQAAVAVPDSATLAAALTASNLPQLSQNAIACIKSASAQTDVLATDLIALLDT
jgi:3-deoxy-D-manno-octulosonic-acid transferase